MPKDQIIFGKWATKASADRSHTHRQIGHAAALTCWTDVPGRTPGSPAD
jgi:hypothetical protein